MKDANSLSNKLAWYNRMPKSAMTNDSMEEMSEQADRLNQKMLQMTLEFMRDYQIQSAGWNCNICEAPVKAVIKNDESDCLYECGCGEWTLEMARGEA